MYVCIGLKGKSLWRWRGGNGGGGKWGVRRLARWGCVGLEGGGGGGEEEARALGREWGTCFM